MYPIEWTIGKVEYPLYKHSQYCRIPVIEHFQKWVHVIFL